MSSPDNAANREAADVTAIAERLDLFRTAAFGEEMWIVDDLDALIAEVERLRATINAVKIELEDFDATRIQYEHRSGDRADRAGQIADAAVAACLGDAIGKVRRALGAVTK